MLKRFAIFSLLLSFCFFASGKNLKVSNFEPNPFDLEGATKQVKDRNGNPCALIKITTDDGIGPLTFEGNVIQSTDDGSETKAYYTNGTKFMQIKAKGFLPLLVTFSDFEIFSLNGKMVYNMHLIQDNSVNEGNQPPSEGFSVVGMFASGDEDPVEAIVRKANEEFGAGDYSASIGHFREAIRYGHPEAQMALGLLYERSVTQGKTIVLEKNDKLAFSLINQAAVQGYEPAQKEIQRFLQLGIGTPIDKEKAEMWKKVLNKEQVVEDLGQIFTSVELQAEFPGGQNAMFKWLASNIKYPETAQQNNVQGKVVCKFIVEKDGSISNVEILRGVDPDLDGEAMRVIRAMPKWNPGMNNGKVVRSYFNLPISFKLAGDDDDKKKKKKK